MFESFHISIFKIIFQKLLKASIHWVYNSSSEKLTLENSQKEEISYMCANIHLIWFTVLEKLERTQIDKNKEMLKKSYFIEYYADVINR